ASSTLLPSWMSMARLTFPSRLELKRPDGSSNDAPFANVILTMFLYVSPVQTMPPWDQTGVPIHFHSSTISGSASCMILRTFASILPRQSPSFLILSSISAAADSAGAGLFILQLQLFHHLALVVRFHGFFLSPTLQRFGLLGGQPGGSTPNCFAYSAFNRCQPPNFIASLPTMRPIGSPARNRSRTSKQMCQPAAPHEMKPRSMLCQSVSRVPPTPSGSSFQRMCCPPSRTPANQGPPPPSPGPRDPAPL